MAAGSRRRRARRRRRMVGRLLIVAGSVSGLVALAAGLQLVDSVVAAPRGASGAGSDEVDVGELLEPGAPAEPVDVGADAVTGAVSSVVPPPDGDPLGLPSVGRPERNSPPEIAAPPGQVLQRSGRTRIENLSVSDPDASGRSELGVLLDLAGASIHVPELPGLRIYGENGSDRVAFAGTLDLVNFALADLQVDFRAQGSLFVYVNDFGHGDMRVALADQARIRLTT